ncbi:MAG: TetR/AcrR family transcriptional regulator [Deltaproteobacteria bacterium]|nr:TetR/AcrR family transcriptional regulator [Deltaproteobacteria bacterium]MBW2395794.1 TetR/AcrR family transcriptional regulator [Deltaproteobacteria bacterium]
MTPERSSGDTRRKILEIAEAEFAQRGYAGAHLQRIASQVGVQKTALYYYFPSKAALFEAVLAGMLEVFDQQVAEVLDKPTSHVERVLEVVDRMNSLLAERRTYAQVLIRIFIDSYEITDSELLQDPIERLFGRLLGFLKEGMDEGVFVRCSSRHLLTSTLGAVVFHYATGPLGAAIFEVDDLFTYDAVKWRAKEIRSLVIRAILVDPEAATGV